MIWSIKNGNVETIKNMSNSNIKSALNYLYKTERLEIAGFTKPFWILKFKEELNYRKERENVIINALPYIKEQINKVTYNIRYSYEKFIV